LGVFRELSFEHNEVTTAIPHLTDDMLFVIEVVKPAQLIYQRKYVAHPDSECVLWWKLKNAQHKSTFWGEHTSHAISYLLLQYKRICANCVVK
jgi:hypothetical protein